MICLSEEANSWSLTRRPPPLTGTQTSTLGNWWSININIFISIWHLPMLTAVQWPTALFQLRDEFSECSILTIAHRLVGTTFYLSCFSYCWSSFWWREWSSQLHTVCLGITCRPQSGFKFNYRLHTVMESDKICVLEKGHLVEMGAPKVLDGHLRHYLNHRHLVTFECF